MKKKRRPPISIPGQRTRTDQPKWGKPQINILLLIIVCLIGHIWLGIQYVRGEDAQLVTMHIDNVRLGGGRSQTCWVTLSYQGETFQESTITGEYNRLKELSEIEVYHIPNTNFVEFNKDAPGRRWIKFTWVTIGFILILVFVYKKELRKLNGLLLGR
ncbi:hypothetical protein [Chitinophaga sp.]|uniref:hypothetical protein n=1 Tax=Chitinophaga sp. TaxID=1869181 RepID=UPI0031D5E745